MEDRNRGERKRWRDIESVRIREKQNEWMREIKGRGNGRR